MKKAFIPLIFPIILGLSGCLGLEERIITSPNAGYKFLRVQEKNLNYRVIYGKEPTLFFVPGFAETSRIYSKIIENPLIKYNRKILIDPWGSGKSDILTNENKTEDVVLAIELVMQKTNTNSAFFIGESRAGTIIPRYAQEHPNKFNGAVLLSAYINNHTKINAPETEITKIPIIGDIYLTAIKLLGDRNTIKSNLEDMVTNPSRELVDETYNQLKLKRCFDSYINGTKNFHPERFDFSEVYKKHPFRFIHGGKDSLIVLKKPLQEKGNPSMRVIKNAKHILTQEVPDEIAREIYEMTK